MTASNMMKSPTLKLIASSTSRSAREIITKIPMNAQAMPSFCRPNSVVPMMAHAINPVIAG